MAKYLHIDLLLSIKLRIRNNNFPAVTKERKPVKVTVTSWWYIFRKKSIFLFLLPQLFFSPGYFGKFSSFQYTNSRHEIGLEAEIVTTFWKLHLQGSTEPRLPDTYPALPSIACPSLWWWLMGIANFTWHLPNLKWLVYSISKFQNKFSSLFKFYSIYYFGFRGIVDWAQEPLLEGFRRLYGVPWIKPSNETLIPIRIFLWPL